MKRFLVAAVSAAFFVVVGCQKNNPDNDPKMMSQDDCPHCPGVQKATSDGKCPVCGMDVKAKMMSADVCEHCPGIQTANAEGKCPICSAKSSASPTTRPGT